LAAEIALIDGEAVAFRQDGHSDFATLRTKVGSARACLVAFDLLSLNGEDLRQRPIEERRAALSPLVAGVGGILLSDVLVAEGALVFAKACEMGLEGIISKRVGSRYSSGNSAMAEDEEPSFPALVRGRTTRSRRTTSQWPLISSRKVRNHCRA
jgi:ATP-dependent DNA ligase